MKSDSQRMAENKYTYKHYKLIACKVKKEVAEEFKEVCAAAGTTPNAVLTKCVLEFIEKNGRP